MTELGRLVFFFILAVTVSACKYRSVMKEVDKVEMAHHDIDRYYLVHTPPNYSPEKKYPLIIVYHGIYSRAKAIAGFSKFNRQADKKGFIVCYPQGHKRAWTIPKLGTELAQGDPDDAGFVNRMIDTMLTDYGIDSDKVFHCGISNGAYLAMYMSNNYSERFAGMALVCGNMALPFEDYYSNIQPMPVLLFGGTKDKLIPYTGGPLKEIVNTYGFPQSVDFWCDKNGCGRLKDSLFIDNDPKDKTEVVHYFNSDPNLRNPVELYKIIGAGHGWPGRGNDIKSIYLGKVSNEINTAEIIADFFLRIKQ